MKENIKEGIGLESYDLEKEKKVEMLEQWHERSYGKVNIRRRWLKKQTRVEIVVGRRKTASARKALHIIILYTRKNRSVVKRKKIKGRTNQEDFRREEHQKGITRSTWLDQVSEDFRILVVKGWTKKKRVSWG